MKRQTLMFVLVATVILAAGVACQSQAEVGSHEDWCEEHEVPESACTRCDVSLVVGFKQRGDWCPEHQRPESQCLICNPDLKIERPSRAPDSK